MKMTLNSKLEYFATEMDKLGSKIEENGLTDELLASAENLNAKYATLAIPTANCPKLQKFVELTQIDLNREIKGALSAEKGTSEWNYYNASLPDWLKWIATQIHTHFVIKGTYKPLLEKLMNTTADIIEHGVLKGFTPSNEAELEQYLDNLALLQLSLGENHEQYSNMEFGLEVLTDEYNGAKYDRFESSDDFIYCLMETQSFLGELYEQCCIMDNLELLGAIQ